MNGAGPMIKIVKTASCLLAQGSVEAERDRIWARCKFVVVIVGVVLALVGGILAALQAAKGKPNAALEAPGGTKPEHGIAVAMIMIGLLLSVLPLIMP